MYRYRLIDEETGSDIGPLISLRLTFGVGEEISRGPGERYVVTALVEPENENFQVLHRRAPAVTGRLARAQGELRSRRLADHAASQSPSPRDLRSKLTAAAAGALRSA